MSDKMPLCVECKEDLTYVDGDNFVCPMCGHEWVAEAVVEVAEREYKDVNGNILVDGDSVVTTEDLKLSAKSIIKRGTKVRNIRLIEPEDGVHDIACKIDGFGSLFLKCSVVKKNK